MRHHGPPTLLSRGILKTHWKEVNSHWFKKKSLFRYYSTCACVSVYVWVCVCAVLFYCRSWPRKYFIFSKAQFCMSRHRGEGCLTLNDSTLTVRCPTLNDLALGGLTLNCSSLNVMSAFGHNITYTLLSYRVFFFIELWINVHV